MGGDHGPRVTLPASLSALSRYPDLSIRLHAELDVLQPILDKLSLSDDLLSRLEIVASGASVAMDEKPSSAVRHRQDSSMSQAIMRSAGASTCLR